MMQLWVFLGPVSVLLHIENACVLRISAQVQLDSGTQSQQFVQRINSRAWNSLMVDLRQRDIRNKDLIRTYSVFKNQMQQNLTP